MKNQVREYEQKAKGSKKELKVLDQLQAQFTHLTNKRKEFMIAMK